MSGFTRAFADAYHGRRVSPARALVTAVAVAVGVYRLLRR